MGWLARAVRAWTSVGAGYPTVDPAADVRAGIGASRTESPHRDLPSDTIEWRWDGHRWARWSTLSQRHDRVDLPVPESLLELVGTTPLDPGSTFRLVGGSWQETTGR